MPRKRFTDASLKALEPAPAGKRLDWMDEVEPGLGVRVTDKGAATFVFVARYPGSSNPTRRELGKVGRVPMKSADKPIMSLAEARAKAAAWRRLIEVGTDPRDHEARAKAAERKRRDTTFGVVVEQFLSERSNRRAAQDAREIRAHLTPAWRDRPLTDIAREDVIALVRSIARRTREKAAGRAVGGSIGATSYQAHNVFGHARVFFEWAIEEGVYGLETSPCDRVNVERIAGAKKPRKRVLSDDELFAYWRAAQRLGYPWGPFFQLLALTGQRRAEVAGMRRGELEAALARLVRDRQEDEEIDWSRVAASAKLWTVPPERFKSDASHMVPLSDGACEILADLPQFKGPCLFSTTAGAKPVSGFSKAKRRLDARMARTLKAVARRRGDDPASVSWVPFENHDVRRTMRTRLAGLRVKREVAEMVIGHGKRGLDRTYDQHEYLDEMREALDKWAGQLRKIVRPHMANVIPLQAAR